MVHSTSPLVTVAIPSFNQAAFLREAITSVLEQDIPTEIYIMDGGSTDGSVDIIKEFAPKVTFWRSESDSGQTWAINEGIAKGCAPYVTWINSDDMLMPGGLSVLVKALESHPEAPVAYGEGWDYFEKEKKWQRFKTKPFKIAQLPYGTFLCQPSTLIRRTAWEKLGGCNEKYQFAMDYDLWWRMYREFGDFIYCDAYVAVNRVHDATKSRAGRIESLRVVMEIVQKYHGRIPFKWHVALALARIEKYILSR